MVSVSRPGERGGLLMNRRLSRAWVSIRRLSRYASLLDNQRLLDHRPHNDMMENLWEKFYAE